VQAFSGLVLFSRLLLFLTVVNLPQLGIRYVCCYLLGIRYVTTSDVIIVNDFELKSKTSVKLMMSLQVFKPS